jgi:hypothetical protein
MMRFMLYTLFGLIVADGLITEFLVTGGLALEKNPLLQAWVGQDSFLILKASGAFLVTVFIWIRYEANPKLMFAITTAALTLYTTIILWNILVFLATQI